MPWCPNGIFLTYPGFFGTSAGASRSFSHAIMGLPLTSPAQIAFLCKGEPASDAGPPVAIGSFNAGLRFPLATSGSCYPFARGTGGAEARHAHLAKRAESSTLGLCRCALRGGGPLLTPCKLVVLPSSGLHHSALEGRRFRGFIQQE